MISINYDISLLSSRFINIKYQWNNSKYLVISDKLLIDLLIEIFKTIGVTNNYNGITRPIIYRLWCVWCLHTYSNNHV